MRGRGSLEPGAPILPEVDRFYFESGFESSDMFDMAAP